MYSITKDGKCAKNLCVIDEKARSVSTTEDGLVFDFTGESGWSFKTGSNCTFDTGYGCTFKTGSDCTFDTGGGCTFKTGDISVVIRRDLYQVIELIGGVETRLNAHGVRGYQVRTADYVKAKMDNEDGLLMVLQNEEWMSFDQF